MADGLLMCGLAGVLAPELNIEKISIFQHLMTVAVLRGEYGGGFAAVPTGSQPVEIRKNPELTASELVHGSDFWSVFGNKQKKTMACMMGHARLPTSGQYGMEAMHPHIHGNVIGCHNGTMKFVNARPIDVKKDLDSSLLFKSISTQGVENTIRSSEGAYALTWINRADDTISFLRNNERSLWFASVEDDDGLYWSSERAMLDFVLKRKVGNKAITLYNLNPDTLLTFRLHNIRRPEIYSHRILTKEAKVVPIKPLAQTSVKERRDDYTLAKMVVYNFEALNRKKTFGQNYLMDDDLQYALDYGCDNCLGPMTYADYEKGMVHWFEPKKFMCQACLEYDPHAQEAYCNHSIPLPNGIKSLLHTRH